MSAELRASLVHRDGHKTDFSVPAGSGVRELAQAVGTLRERVSAALTELVDQEKAAGVGGGGGRGESAGEEEADESDDDDDDDGGDKAVGLGQTGAHRPGSGLESGSGQAARDGAVKRGARQRETSTKSPAKKKKD